MYKAFYLPATDNDDPSKSGFPSENEAWDYVDTQVCSDCLNGKNHSPCYAEWMVDTED